MIEFRFALGTRVMVGIETWTIASRGASTPEDGLGVEGLGLVRVSLV